MHFRRCHDITVKFSDYLAMMARKHVVAIRCRQWNLEWTIWNQRGAMPYIQSEFMNIYCIRFDYCWVSFLYERQWNPYLMIFSRSSAAKNGCESLGGRRRFELFPWFYSFYVVLCMWHSGKRPIAAHMVDGSNTCTEHMLIQCLCDPRSHATYSNNSLPLQKWIISIWCSKDECIRTIHSIGVEKELHSNYTYPFDFGNQRFRRK